MGAAGGVLLVVGFALGCQAPGVLEEAAAAGGGPAQVPAALLGGGGRTEVYGTVAAMQAGPWSVDVRNTPNVRLAGPAQVQWSGAPPVTLAGTPAVTVSGGAVQVGNGDNNAVPVRTPAPLDVQFASTPQVNVTGIPPVTINGTAAVNVVGTPTVTVAGTPEVSVVNGAVQVANADGNPVPVKVVSQPRPAFQPWGAQVNLVMGEPDANASAQVYTVPAGKRLVVEFASISNTVPTGQMTFASVAVITAGVPLSFAIPLHLTMAAGGADIWAEAQPLKLHADPGSGVVVYLWRNNFGVGNGTCQGRVTLSGYLEDVP